MPKIKPAHLIIAFMLIAFALFVLPQVLRDQPGARKTSGTLVTETIGLTETNSSADYTLRLLEGSDAEHEADHIFESLTGLPGVGKATFDTATLVLTVEFDTSAIDERAVGDRLMGSGYLVPTAADATPTELAPEGDVQRIAIADDGNGFQPWLIRATAGVPIEMDFAPGTECRVQVKFSDLGIEQDISQGGVVALPALEPGSYQISCGGDGNEGTLIVE